jgi:hypothetical protein
VSLVGDENHAASIAILAGAGMAIAGGPVVPGRRKARDS